VEITQFSCEKSASIKIQHQGGGCGGDNDDDDDYCVL